MSLGVNKLTGLNEITTNLAKRPQTPTNAT